MSNNSHEFILYWRKLGDSKAKAVFLKQILASTEGSSHLLAIFKHEIPFGLLGEFIKVMSQELGAFECKILAAFLQSLTQTGRFSLSLTFLSSEEVTSLHLIFNYLEEAGIDCNTLSQQYLR